MNMQKLKAKLPLLLGLAGFYVVMMVLNMTGIVNDYIMRIVILGMINIIMAVSLNLINGYMGLLSIGHAGFMIAGGYVAGFMTTLLFQISSSSNPLFAYGAFAISIVCAAIVAGLAGFLIGLPALRLDDDYLAIVTIGFGEIIRVIFNFITFKKNIGGYEMDIGGPRGLLGIPYLTNFTTAFIVMILVVIFIRNFVYSRHGRACVAIRESEIAASMMGINVTRYKVLVFVIGSAIAGIGGALQGHYIQMLHPTMGGFMKSVEYMIIVYLGGMGSISGSIIAALGLTALSEFLRPIGELRMVIYGLLLVILMLRRPSGLMGKTEFPILVPERERVRHAQAK